MVSIKTKGLICQHGTTAICSTISTESSHLFNFSLRICQWSELEWEKDVDSTYGNNKRHPCEIFSEEEYVTVYPSKTSQIKQANCIKTTDIKPVNLKHHEFPRSGARVPCIPSTASEQCYTNGG
ncbi:unnamed protein product [Clavelina lepadiformis]|uniref:Uncharacterized protein n=1 Tax=Clavelina lepadiformis TaxID=159417 RepID=A0ABP0GKL3_CLALP